MPRKSTKKSLKPVRPQLGDEDVKHARLTDFQYAGDTKPSGTDPRVRKPYPVTAVNQIKSEPDAATGASHH